MHNSNPKKNAGFGMLEVLVSMIIILVGLLGLAGLITLGQKAEMESYQRGQALILLNDMEDRINANRKVASCYAITNLGEASEFLGTDGLDPAACDIGTAEQQATRDDDLASWNNALLGAAEVTGGGNVGAMIGARGCIEQLDPVENIYLVSVAWQGLSATFAPPDGLACAKDLYGADAQRRVVSTTLRIANLTAP
jgi:type IV pilus assembly protein PilV